MKAKQIMTTDVVTALADEKLGQLLPRMQKVPLRMLPVVNSDNIVEGVVSTFSIMEHLLPSYVSSGDLKDISFAPDMNILSHHLNEQQKSSVSELMDAPLLVKGDDYLLSVATDLIRYGKHECALVVDEQQRLLGVISAGDILNALRQGCGHD